MHQKYKTLILIFLFFIILSSIYYFNNKKDVFKTYSFANEKQISNKDIKNNKNDINLDEKDTYCIIKVYISGEVNKPGVYSIEENSRIDDLIKMADGVTKEADLENINLALILSDEEHIVVPKKNKEIQNNVNDIKENCTSINVSSKKSDEHNKIYIDINKANIEELKKLPGIGPVIAENIVEYRNKNGKFKNIEDIKSVKRIGEETFKKLKDNIYVSK